MSITSPDTTYTNSSSAECQWRWLEAAPGGRVSRLTPNCVRPAAPPSGLRARPLAISWNGAGYPEPFRSGTDVTSIFGMAALLSTAWPTRYRGCKLSYDV